MKLLAVCKSSWPFLFLFLFVCIAKSFSHQKHRQEKIAGMDMHVGHSTVVKSMLVKGIMFAVQPEAPILDVNKYISYLIDLCFVE